jgi:DNA polymerase-3 subunit gamma/tau
MTTELYKKHRPRSLKAVIGAESSTAALANMIDKGTLPHTVLFHGPSGCGKTTLARILKTELKCHDMDWKEMNCSDVRGVDSVRDISRLMHLAPTGGDVRIWLLDEIHQWTKDAQHAALKMLEDTPSHVYFFLCTTDPQKLLKTILTRCCEMPVRLLTEKELTSLVNKVCKREKVEISEEVLEEIVSGAQGSARTALVLLDKTLNLKEDERVAAIQAKLSEMSEAIELCRALMKKADWTKVCGVLRNLKGEPESIRYAVLGYARSVLLKTKNVQAYKIICAFENNFYDSKAAGVVRASFEAIFG